MWSPAHGDEFPACYTLFSIFRSAPGLPSTSTKAPLRSNLDCSVSLTRSLQVVRRRTMRKMTPATKTVRSERSDSTGRPQNAQNIIHSEALRNKSGVSG